MVGGGENTGDGRGEDKLPYQGGCDRGQGVYGNSMQRSSSRPMVIVLDKDIKDNRVYFMLSKVVILPVIGEGDRW